MASILPARDLAWVFLAGGTGAALRVWLAAVVDRRLVEVLPYAGTLTVNLIGCLAIGIGTAMLPLGHLRPILLGGLLGGFTTFSAFGLLSWELLDQGRHGAFALQVGIHLVLGIVLVWAGLALGRALVGPGTPLS